MKMQVLSIDAWTVLNDGEDSPSWEWNNWFRVGNIDISDKDTDYQIIEKMFVNGFISNIQDADLEDDQYNYVIVDKQTREPLFAIEYGSVV
jgi:hypothetical protein